MAVKFIDDCSDSTQDLSLWDATSGTVATDSGTSVTGGRSIKFTSSVAGAQAWAKASSVINGTSGRLNFNYKNTDLPATSEVPIIFMDDSLETSAMTLNVSTTGKLQLGKWITVGQTYTVLGSAGATTIGTGWRRICMCWTISSTTVNEFRVYLDGVLEITASNIVLPVTAFIHLYIGWLKTGDGNSKVGNFDDIYHDDSSSLADTGDIHVTAKRPFANGTANAWTTQIGAGGSGYGSGHSSQVNERPLSQTNGWSLAAAGASLTEEYNIESASTGDVDLTGKRIRAVFGWVFTKVSAGSTNSIMVDGTLTNFTNTTSAKPFRQLSPNPTTYPTGTGTDIGIKSATSSTHSLYECGILVAYIQPITATPGVLALTTTKFAPLVSTPRLVTVGKLGLVLATFIPKAIVGTVSVPGVKNLVTTKFTPNILLPKLSTPSKLALILTEFAPVIGAPNPITVTPGTRSLILTTYIPTAHISLDQRAVPGTAHLVITRYRPQILLPFPIGGNSSLLVINEDYLANLQEYFELNWGNFWLIDDYVPLVMLDQD